MEDIPNAINLSQAVLNRIVYYDANDVDALKIIVYANQRHAHHVKEII